MIYKTFAFLLLVAAFNAVAATQDDYITPGGHWMQAAEHSSHTGDITEAERASSVPAGKISLTGGSYWMQTRFDIHARGFYVIDFKNTSIIARFEHLVYNDSGKQVAKLGGGINASSANPFFLSNGRSLELSQGSYRLVTRISSDYYLAQPEPYITPLERHQQNIKPAATIVMVGLGIFLGLGIYYSTLAIMRKRLAEAMYALFILGNFIFNAGAHLVLKDLFSINTIYTASTPILFSNISYIIFVLALLKITQRSHARLFYLGATIIAVLSGFVLLSAWLPNWSMEFARYGVGLFLSFGLIAGIVRTRESYPIARYYLIANIIFFILGGIAITSSQLSGLYEIHIEHIGLLAVASEVILLALVLSAQFALLQNENDQIQRKLVFNRRLANTDALTGLYNRLKLDDDLSRIEKQAGLSYIDLDHLKYYNDQYGHEHGDELLRQFSKLLDDHLSSHCTLFRVGGDEFAVITPDGDISRVEMALDQTIAQLKERGFSFAGASLGSAHFTETDSTAELKQLADSRMYENKDQRKKKIINKRFGNI